MAEEYCLDKYVNQCENMVCKIFYEGYEKAIDDFMDAIKNSPCLDDMDLFGRTVKIIYLPTLEQISKRLKD